jgi:putative endonuclease
MSKTYFVYISASKKDGVLYVGVTNSLNRRTFEHVFGKNESFTKKYFVHKLVYFETCGEITDAIRREKQIKKWNRQWKVNLIEKQNPQWEDLFPIILGIV